MNFPTPQNQAYQRAAGSYGANAATTASPARLLVMLYDRLSLDLTRAHRAQLEGDREVANDNIAHAQDIVAELLSSLDTEAWDGAAGLASLYRWVIRELIAANIRMDPERTAGCIAVIEPLREAWTQAMTSVPANVAGPLLGASA
ncbi:flagellar export chaperone FliS [Angustibacter sp. McL0619]|uniref:flagellar export chaperone FliS n=1 Tax=Angustibacter sp. McL0619 TaxID=3415676 RepID=UPI003CED9FB8